MKKKSKKDEEPFELPAVCIAKKYVSSSVLKASGSFAPSEEEIVAISLANMRGLYKAKCRDQQLPIVHSREQRFFELIYKSCSGLKFSLKEHGLGEQSAIALVKVLGRNRTYSLLDLSGNRFRDEGTILLAPLFKINDTIVRADFRSNDIGSRGAEALFYALCHNKTLTSLDLSGLSGINRNHIGIKGAVALKQLLATPTSVICHLNLASNGMGVEGIHLLCDGMKVNRCIEYLNISSNNIGSNGCDYLVNILDGNNLSSLIMERNAIGDRGITLLAAALRGSSHPSITFLDLSYNRIGKNGVKEFCEMLKLDTRITTVKLDGNEIGNEGAGHVAAMLEVNKHIRNLSVAKNEIENPGCRSIGISLEENGALRSLNLSSNYISDVSQLCAALSKNDVLQRLDLSNNRIDNIGGRSIPVMLNKNRSLRHLNIKQNDMKDFEKKKTPSAAAARKRQKQKKKRIKARRRKMQAEKKERMGMQRRGGGSRNISDGDDSDEDIYEFYFSGSHLSKRQREINQSFERLYNDSKKSRSSTKKGRAKNPATGGQGMMGGTGVGGMGQGVGGVVGGLAGGMGMQHQLTPEEQSALNSSIGTKISNSLKRNNIILTLEFAYNNFSYGSYSSILGYLKRNKKLFKRQQKMELRRKIVTMEMREEDLKSTVRNIKEETSTLVTLNERLTKHLDERKRLTDETKRVTIELEDELNRLTKERRDVERKHEEVLIQLQGQEKEFRIQSKKLDDRINGERERISKYDTIYYELERDAQEVKQKFKVDNIELYNEIRECEGEVENDMITIRDQEKTLEEEAEKNELLKLAYKEYIQMKKKQKGGKGRRGGSRSRGGAGGGRSQGRRRRN